MDYVDLYIYHIWDYNTPSSMSLKHYTWLSPQEKLGLLVFQTVTCGS